MKPTPIILASLFLASTATATAACSDPNLSISATRQMDVATELVTPERVAPELVAEAQARFEHFFETNQSPIAGVSVTVIRNGEIIFNSSLGYADLETQQATTTDTRYRIYSTSKALTAVAAMRVAEQGLLDLDAPIGDIMPTLPEHIQPITARQLMSHRSGIRHYNSGEWVSVTSSNCAGPLEALPPFINDPLRYDPGTEHSYTSFGYVLLSAVIEAASGNSYEDTMSELVFAPAGMTATAVEGRPVEGFPVATFYFHQPDEEPEWFRTIDYEPSIIATCKFGGGGFVSSSEDLARFGHSLLQGELVTEAGRDALWTLHSPNGEFPGYGLGFFDSQWWLHHLDAWRTSEGHAPDQPRTFPVSWFHGGTAAGGNSYLFIYPDEDLIIATAMTNSAGGNIAMLNFNDIASVFFREEEAE